MKMKIRLLNVGGINKEISLSIEKGVTIYKAPNAYGKTSLARSLVSLLTSKITAEDLLNVFSDEGFIEVELNGDLYYRRFKRIKNKIVEEKKLIMDDENALLLSYFSPENPLVARILTGDENVEWFISATSKIEELKKKKESLLMKREEVKEKYDRLSKVYQDIQQLMTAISKIDKEIEKLEEEKRNVTINTEQSIRLTRQNRMEELKSRLEARMKELKEKEARISKLEKEINELKQKYPPNMKDQIQNELNEIEKKIQEHSSKKNNLDVEEGVINRILIEIKEAEKEHAAVCNVCGSKVDPSIWKARLDIMAKELERISKDKNNVISELSRLQTRRNELQAKLKDIEKTQELLLQKEKALESAKLEAEQVRYNIESIQRQIKELEEKVSKMNDTYVLETRESDIDKRIEELNKKRADIEYQLQQLGVPKKVMEEIENSKGLLEEIDKEIDNTDREYIRRLTVVKTTFTELANKLMKELEFDYSAEIDEKYRLSVKKNNVRIDLKKLSSSEKTALALVLVLVALKEYFKTPFFIVDESFMTFDPERFEKLVRYLNGVVDYIIVTKSDEALQIKSEKLPATMEPLALS